MFNCVRLSPVNQRFFQRKQIATQNFSCINSKTPNNKLGCDVFVNGCKNQINFASNDKARKSSEITAAAGTHYNPYIVETKDIALGDEKQPVEIYSTHDKLQTYLNHFLIDVDKSSSIPIQGIGSPIEQAYGNHILKSLLRDMQFNGKISDKEIEDLKAQYHEKSSRGEEIRNNYKTDEQYVQALIQKACDNLEEQKEFIKKLAPSTQDCVLYKGIEHYIPENNFQYRLEFYNLL